MTTIDKAAKSRRLPALGPARLVAVSLVALSLFALSLIAGRAHAPGIAVAEFDLAVREAPAADGLVLTELPAGAEMELTGDASGEFVQVVAGGVTGWVEVSTIHAGQIDTAMTNALTQITDAPNDDGRLLTVVPAGSTVILTGAAVDVYLAASFDGTGGWLPAANLAP